MSDFIQQQGLPFFSHLLWRLQDHFVRACATWYEEVGVEAPPRTHSTLKALEQNGPLSVTEIASLLRQSHPLVITWIRQLKNLGLVESRGDPLDGRRSLIQLTSAGELELHRQNEADAALSRAYDQVMRDADAEIYEALWRMEAALRVSPFLERLRQEQRSVSDDKIS